MKDKTESDENLIKLTTLIPHSFKERLLKISKAKDRSISYIVRKALSEYLNKHE